MKIKKRLNFNKLVLYGLFKLVLVVSLYYIRTKEILKYIIKHKKIILLSIFFLFLITFRVSNGVLEFGVPNFIRLNMKTL